MALDQGEDLLQPGGALAAGPVELDEQRRPRVLGVTGVGHVFARADGEVIHHLDGRRDDPLLDDLGDDPGGIAGRLEEGHERLDRLGRRHDAQQDLRHDAERPLGANEGRREVIPRPVELRAADRHELAVGQDHLESAHVVCREAVLEAVRTAGVLRHVAADRADDLARRVGRVEEVGRHGLRDGDVRHARLNEDTGVVEVHLEHPVHAVQADKDPPSTGTAPPESPLPEPRATQGTPASQHARTTAWTSSVRAGRTAARGRAWYWSSASDS